MTTPASRQPGTTAAGWRWPVGFALVLCVYTLPLAGRPPLRNPNELSRIELAVSLGYHGAASIDDVIPIYGHSQDRSVRDGRSYSDKAPGLSLMAVPLLAAARSIVPSDEAVTPPAYWRLRPALTWFLVAVPGALLPFLLLRSYAPIEPADRTFLALLFALSTPLLTYATVFFGHVPAGVLAASAYVLVLRPGRPAYRPSTWISAGGGVLAGLAVATEYPTAIIGVIVFLTMALRRHGVRPLAGFAAGALIGVMPALLYHHAAFGSIWTTGYALKNFAQHAEIHAEGFFGVSLPTLERLWGVTAGMKRGIVFYCPLLLLMPVGLVMMARRHRRDAGPLTAVFLCYLCFASGFVDWQGGWSAAARHLVPPLPLCIFPVALAVRRMTETRTWGLVVVGLTAMSLCGALLSIAVTPFFPEDVDAPLVQVAMRSLFHGAAGSNLISEATRLPAVVGVCVIAAIVVGLVALALVHLLGANRGSARVSLPIQRRTGLDNMSD